MDRAVLLVLLGIPILVVLHIALFRQPIPGQTAFRNGEYAQLRGHWQMPQSALPSRFVIVQTDNKGS